MIVQALSYGLSSQLFGITPKTMTKMCQIMMMYHINMLVKFNLNIDIQLVLVSIELGK